MTDSIRHLKELLVDGDAASRSMPAHLDRGVIVRQVDFEDRVQALEAAGLSE
jgi:hypothetical protein